ncbi:hypothetical protein [Paenibacillus alvei]|uniref:hypothetical protein n=1 Tax=Paenibacillus alvei TaxID=44250 RepID=UPI0018CED872|nr:hypothetical protein [Paenibacillus alvei]MBG9735813.1 hypothetical protein [Paenibacillus alvei]MBG9736677.1 hypothetical protein [Paenibacillus alvei]MBG9736693.1 hypothetical protein [Paenibacillus alvei]MBG9743463.1 hypothetical protein [Paenibacillus alvei]MBG9745654.1 hypothetical protein [Paenibacillus alvei]
MVTVCKVGEQTQIFVSLMPTMGARIVLDVMLIGFVAYLIYSKVRRNRKHSVDQRQITKEESR